MPRSRNIKPGFFKNEILAEIDPLGRILFEGLWCLADREGRLEDREKRIKAEVLPYDECNVSALLSALSKKKFITRYEVSGEKYIQVTEFKRHQHPHVNEAGSVLPPYDASTVPAPELGDTNPSDSLILIPDSLNLNTDSLSRLTNREVKKMFLEFWELYPKRKNKAQAERTWLKIKLTTDLFSKITSGIERAKKGKAWIDYQYIPYPATWLNSKGWEDEAEPDPNQQAKQNIETIQKQQEERDHKREEEEKRRAGI